MAQHWDRDTVYRGRRVKLDVAIRLDGWRRIAVSPKMREATTRVVEDRALPYAVSISPVDQGTYARSWGVAQGFEWAGHAPLPPMRRVSTQLANSAFHAVIVEVGREGKNAFRVLQKTLEYLHATRNI